MRGQSGSKKARARWGLFLFIEISACIHLHENATILLFIIAQWNYIVFMYIFFQFLNMHYIYLFIHYSFCVYELCVGVCMSYCLCTIQRKLVEINCLPLTHRFQVFNSDYQSDRQVSSQLSHLTDTVPHCLYPFIC